MKSYCKIILSFLIGILCSNVLVSQDYIVYVDSANYKNSLNDMLILYCDSGNFDVAKKLIGYGADPNASNEFGITPLMYATQSGSYELVKLLLSNNADPNAKPFDGNTALHAAVRVGNDSIAELLIQNKALVNLANNVGHTPLHYSAWYGLPYLTDVLVYHNANPNAKDLYGYTPLTLSVYSGAYLSSKILLENGANLNLPSNEGVSPLMIAAQYNDTAMVNLLLKYNVDISMLDKNGANALAYAISCNSKDVVLLLVDKGAFNQKISKNYYQIAAETEYKAMALLLDSLGHKAKLKPTVGSFCFGSGTLFSNHEYMWGFNVGFMEKISKLNVSIGYWLRPYPIATLRYKGASIFQYREKRQVLDLRVSRFVNIRTFSSGRHFGAYFGGNVGLVFRDFRGTTSDPKTSVYPGLNAGLFFGGEKTKLTAGWEYTGLKTPEATPHRFGLHLYFYIPVGKLRMVNTQISHVD